MRGEYVTYKQIVVSGAAVASVLVALLLGSLQLHAQSPHGANAASKEEVETLRLLMVESIKEISHTIRADIRQLRDQMLRLQTMPMGRGIKKSGARAKQAQKFFDF